MFDADIRPLTGNFPLGLKCVRVNSLPVLQFCLAALHVSGFSGSWLCRWGVAKQSNPSPSLGSFKEMLIVLEFTFTEESGRGVSRFGPGLHEPRKSPPGVSRIRGLAISELPKVSATTASIPLDTT